MGKLFYSYQDGIIYLLHDHCDLKALMSEQAGDNGILIYARKCCLELIEYKNGKETQFKTSLIHSEENAFGEMAETCLYVF